MAQPVMEWESRLGRRFRLRDLYILSTVVERGSMAKAAVQLRMAQPSISEAIAKLEDTLKVQLLDRGPRGIEPTIFANALLKRGFVVFDELRQGIREIEFLNDPASGEVRVGCPESLAGFVSTAIERMTRQYPQIRSQVVPTEPLMMQMGVLRDRNIDLLVARLAASIAEDDITTEALFEDRLVIVTGLKNRWARRRKVALSDLMDEQWILMPHNNLLMPLVIEAFRASGVDLPKACVSTVSVHVRCQLLATGRYVAIMPGSAVRHAGERWGLKVLPIDLELQTPPVGILTLKNRTLGPATEIFIRYARETAKSMAARLANP